MIVYLGEALFPTRWCYIGKLLKLDSFCWTAMLFTVKKYRNNDVFAKDWDRERQLPHPLPPSYCRDPYFKYFLKNLHLDMMFQVTFFLTNSNMVMDLFLELILLLTTLLIKERLLVHSTVFFEFFSLSFNYYLAKLHNFISRKTTSTTIII